MSGVRWNITCQMQHSSSAQLENLTGAFDPPSVFDSHVARLLGR